MNKKALLNGVFSILIFVSIFLTLGVFLLTNITNSFESTFNETVMNNYTNSAAELSGSFGIAGNLIFLIIFLGFMIGILFISFNIGSGGFGSTYYNNDDDDDNEEEEEEDDENKYSRKILEGSTIPEIRESSEGKTYDKNKFEGKSKYD